MKPRLWLAALAAFPLGACVQVEPAPYYGAPASNTAAGAVTGAAAGGLLGAVLGRGGGAIVGGAAAGALVGGLIGNSADQRDEAAAQGYYAAPQHQQPYADPYGRPYEEQAPRGW